MALLTEEDKRRLGEEGRQALRIIAAAIEPLLLPLLAGSPVSWSLVLLPLAGQLSKVVSTADVLLLMRALLKLLALMRSDAPEDIYVGSGVDRTGPGAVLTAEGGVFVLKQKPMDLEDFTSG